MAIIMEKMFVLCPSLTQPRYHKRAAQLRENFNVQILGFSRGLYEINNFSEDFKVEDLGRVKDGQYLSRIFSMIRAIFILRRNIKKFKASKNYFYVFGLDGVIIARLSGLKVGFYEVGDIRFSRGNGNILSFLENFLSKYFRGVIVTSPSFINEIKKSGPQIKNLPFHVIENKLPRGLQRPDLKNKAVQAKSKIIIGVIGFLRYEKPLRLLRDFVLQHKNRFELLCWGDGPCKTLFEKNPSSNIHFFGSFKNPESLESIYSNIDLNFVVYGGVSSSEIGVELALPNKLYESMFYHVPILCRDKTEVGKIAVKNGVGINLNETNFDAQLLSITRDKIEDMRIKCGLIETKELIDDGQNVIASLKAFLS